MYCVREESVEFPKVFSGSVFALKWGPDNVFTTKGRFNQFLSSIPITLFHTVILDEGR
jgi:hypothetical protein